MKESSTAWLLSPRFLQRLSKLLLTFFGKFASPSSYGAQDPNGTFENYRIWLAVRKKNFPTQLLRLSPCWFRRTPFASSSHQQVTPAISSYGSIQPIRLKILCYTSQSFRLASGISTSCHSISGSPPSAQYCPSISFVSVLSATWPLST